jgi:hypothetical protein
VTGLHQIQGSDRLLLLEATQPSTHTALNQIQQQQQQQAPVSDVGGAAATVLSGVWQQIPPVMQQHLQHLLPAPQQQQQQDQEGVGSSSTEPLLATASLPAPAAAGAATAAAPAYLLSWGMWSILTLLVLAQVGWQGGGSRG